MEDEEEEGRYSHGRDGDHLLGVPFECDLCHFRNINHRDPNARDKKDDFTLICIRRANLDALWGREPSTVKANLNRMLRDHRDAMSMVNISNPLPVMGNPRMADRVGMKAAVMTLVSSLRKGRYTKNLQWDSMRKTPTWYGSLYDAGSGYVNESVIGREDKKQYVSDAPTGGKWFARFMRGAKLRMGVERRQNEALTSEIVLSMDRIVETRWQAAQSETERERLEEVMCYTLCEFGAGLRGEEVPLISLKGLLTYWDETQRHETPHIMLTLQGRFKGEVNSRWHCVPVVNVSQSGIPFQKWLQRLVIDRRATKQGRRDGWLFCRRNGTRGKLSDYDDLFKEILGEVKEQGDGLIPDATEVDDFSLWRSGRRGSTTETSNKNVDIQVIELVNRWRSKEAAKGAEPGLPMRQVYMSVKHAVPAMLLYSGAL